MANQIVPVEEVAKDLVRIWDETVGAHFRELRERGISEREIKRRSEAMLAALFGGLMTSPK